jgi:hypothetical protein
LNEDEFRLRSEMIRDLMHFKNRTGVGYWVEYLSEFGVDHLVLPQANVI